MSELKKRCMKGHLRQRRRHGFSGGRFGIITSKPTYLPSIFCFSSVLDHLILLTHRLHNFLCFFSKAKKTWHLCRGLVLGFMIVHSMTSENKYVPARRGEAESIDPYLNSCLLHEFNIVMRYSKKWAFKSVLELMTHPVVMWYSDPATDAMS